MSYRVCGWLSTPLSKQWSVPDVGSDETGCFISLLTCETDWETSATTDSRGRDDTAVLSFKAGRESDTLPVVVLSTRGGLFWAGRMVELSCMKHGSSFHEVCNFTWSHLVSSWMRRGSFPWTTYHHLDRLVIEPSWSFRLTRNPPSMLHSREITLLIELTLLFYRVP